MTGTRSKETLLTILAVATVPLLLLPYFVELSNSGESIVLAADIFIWTVFALDLAVSTYRADDRINYLRTHWTGLKSS